MENGLGRTVRPCDSAGGGHAMRGSFGHAARTIGACTSGDGGSSEFGPGFSRTRGQEIRRD